MPKIDADVTALLPRLEPFLREWIDTQRTISGVPAVQVAVRVGSDLLFSHASGVTDSGTREPVTTQHAFRIASHSKTFTAALIMQLVERGQLSLEDTVASLVPQLADAPVGSRTVRALLGHQAGVERDGLDANWWQRAKVFPSRAELIDELRRDSVYPANQYFHYSNLAYSLLGVIIENVTGRSFHDVALDVVDVLSEFMGAPALIGPEMGVGPEASIVSGHIAPWSHYKADDETIAPVVAPVHTYAESSATGFWANAETISAWGAAHAIGTGLFLSDETKRVMQRRESTITKAGVTRFYGLGWIQRMIGERRVIGHSGGFPGHITQTWADPETGLAVSVLTNRIDGKASDWATAIINLLDAAVRETKRAKSGTEADGLAGTYWALWGANSIVTLPGVVLQLSPAAVDPASMATVMHFDDDGTIRSVAEDGFGDAGEPLRVERDEHGVASITVTGITQWREDLYRAKRGDLLAAELPGGVL